MKNGYREFHGQKVHRQVMEKHLMRPLSIHEVVHHIDGNRLNNDIKNLQLMTIEEHTSLHHAGSKHKRKQQYQPSAF